MLLHAPRAIAQVTPDGTLPTHITSPNALDFTIDGGGRSGSNLFHSFSQFSVPTGGSAFFNNALDVQNIFARITGGTVSTIDGLIKAKGSASLFLLNPSGILFGPNAALNLGGSFMGTTADHFRFADGTQFSAVNPSPPLLTMSVPVGLQMGANPGAITNQSIDFGVPVGKTLALVGGDIFLQGSGPAGYAQLYAPDGRLELGSVGAHSEVAIVPSPSDWALNYSGVQNFRDIHLTQTAYVGTNGKSGGSTQVQGRRVSLSEGSWIYSDTTGSGHGGNLQVFASEALSLDRGFISTYVYDTASGHGGSVKVTTPNLVLNHSSGIYAETGGMGHGGNLTIDSDTVKVFGNPDGNGKPSFLSTQTLGDGQGGNLTINAQHFYAENWSNIGTDNAGGTGNAGNLTMNVQQLTLVNGPQIASSTFGQGNGGNVIINATDSMEVRGFNTGAKGPFSSGIFASAEPGSTGNAGNLFIQTHRLSVTQGGKIATNLVGSGNAGNMVIRAQEIEVADPLVDFTGAISGIVASVVEGARGNGGNLDIQAAQLRVVNGGQITSSTDGQGNAGHIKIQANLIDLSGTSPDGQYRSSIAAKASRPFSAGSITLNSDRLNIQDGAEITVSNSSTGDSGQLTIQTHSLVLDRGGTLRAEVNGGSQGNIQIQARDLVLLKQGSSIVTSATGQSKGGNISINAPIIIGLGNSDIIANATQGSGGNVNITTQGIFGLKDRDRLTSENDITASSEFGIKGTVQVNTIGIDPNVGLTELSVSVVDASQKIATSCFGAKGSQFIITGRGGLPDNPTQESMYNLTWSDLRDFSASQNTASQNTTSQNTASQNTASQNTLVSIAVPIPIPQSPLVQAARFQRNADGSIELVANSNPLTASWGATCSSYFQ
ncbi:S-layer family protein [Alkalinema sp. FACHB-956]|uniref:beta strand repeat-containing protein n=1 Tax=Alkalinema sp. FACHB-956 TaxID=2692768 RepID=UPI0016830805|nr:S-layer family protein [Alkalinema sp. FACHB-956]MBD2329177.1 S-layer family protein [Alkalinema sp. FACHB-956]